MPSIYRQNKGDRNPTRIRRVDGFKVKAAMADIMRSMEAEGFTLRGVWSDFMVCRKDGAAVMNFFVNWISGDHDEKSGARTAGKAA